MLPPGVCLPSHDHPPSALPSIDEHACTALHTQHLSPCGSPRPRDWEAEGRHGSPPCSRRRWALRRLLISRFSQEIPVAMMSRISSEYKPSSHIPRHDCIPQKPGSLETNQATSHAALDLHQDLFVTRPVHVSLSALVYTDQQSKASAAPARSPVRVYGMRASHWTGSLSHGDIYVAIAFSIQPGASTTLLIIRVSNDIGSVPG